jgi:hypothetical protein
LRDKVGVILSAHGTELMIQASRNL